MAKFLTMDKSSLEEMAVDLADIQDALTSLIEYGTISLVAKRVLKQARYRLATYLKPICCACGETPARYTKDAYYCERCVIKNEND